MWCVELLQGCPDVTCELGQALSSSTSCVRSSAPALPREYIWPTGWEGAHMRHGGFAKRCCAHVHEREQHVAWHAQVKLHAWFAGLDWANLARTKAAFIPALDSPTDTAYFAPKPARIPKPLDLQGPRMGAFQQAQRGCSASRI